MHHVLQTGDGVVARYRITFLTTQLKLLITSISFQITLGAMSVAARGKNNNRVETLVGLLHNPQCVHLPGGRSGRVG